MAWLYREQEDSIEAMKHRIKRETHNAAIEAAAKHLKAWADRYREGPQMKQTYSGEMLVAEIDGHIAAIRALLQ